MNKVRVGFFIMNGGLRKTWKIKAQDNKEIVRNRKITKQNDIKKNRVVIVGGCNRSKN